MNTDNYFPGWARTLLASLLLLLLLVGSACDDTVEPDEPLSITITQPTNGTIVRDSIMRIIADVRVKCGCNSHVEFHIDGVHMYSDYLPFYSFDVSTDGMSGEHLIAARLVVKDVGETWDSIRVVIAGSDSLRRKGSSQQ